MNLREILVTALKGLRFGRLPAAEASTKTKPKQVRKAPHYQSLNRGRWCRQGQRR